MDTTTAAPTPSIETAIAERFGVDVQISFDFRRFRLVCERIDGYAITPGMQAMFDDLVEREYRSQLTPRAAIV